LGGLSDDNSSVESAGKNLATVIGEGTPSEVAHVETMVRGFLQKMYVETMDTLKANSTYLDAVIHALSKQHFLMQEDLLAIYEQSTNQPRRAA
jgi:ATP-dependent Zn protease